MASPVPVFLVLASLTPLTSSWYPLHSLIPRFPDSVPDNPPPVIHICFWNPPQGLGLMLNLPIPTLMKAMCLTPDPAGCHQAGCLWAVWTLRKS